VALFALVNSNLSENFFGLYRHDGLSLATPSLDTCLQTTGRRVISQEACIFFNAFVVTSNNV